MWYLLIFFLGTAVGSFVNVLVSRSISGQSWVGGRSRCDYCGKVLSWYDLIPLLSFVAYRGRSRCCKRPLSYRHLIVELMFGVLFVWWALVGVAFFHLISHPFGYIQPLFWLVTGILMGIVFVSDSFYGLIPTNVVYIGGALVVGYRLILINAGSYEPKDLFLSVVSGIGACLFLYLLRIMTKGRGMGEGDPYLALWIGLLLGWPRVLVSLWVAFVVGALVSVVLVIFKKKNLGGTVPFGPFLITGVVITLLWGGKLLSFL